MAHMTDIRFENTGSLKERLDKTIVELADWYKWYVNHGFTDMANKSEEAIYALDRMRRSLYTGGKS